MGFGGIWYLKNYNAASLILVSTAYNTVSNYVLISVPLFILMGHLSLNAGLAQKAYSAGFKIVGGLPGGLAMASSIGCGVFAAATGSSAATAATLGKVAVPEMKKYGYDSGFACAAVAGGGSIGILIPPSIVLIIYGMITDLSIGKLLIAGVIPGILTILAIMLVSYFSAIINPKLAPRGPKTSLREKINSMSGLWGFIILIVIVLGGIYAGIFTPTEAAAVSAVYAFLIAVFIYRDIRFKDVPKVLTESAKTTAMLMFSIANAYLFAFVLTTEQIPQAASEWIIGLGLPPWGFLIVVNILLLVFGNFMEPTSVVLILTPIIFPIATQMGIDPIHLGVMMVLNMQIGLVTPPVGLNLFVTASVAKTPMEEVIKAAVPWLIVLFTVLILVTYIPWISLIVPTLLGVI